LKFFSAVRGLLDAGVELKVLTDVARVYGDTLRRLAQTEVRLIRSFIGESGHSSVLKDRAQSERLEAVQEVVGPVLEPLLLNIHRQHLLRASVMESVAALESEEKGSDRDVIEATIVFVDLASFTPLAQVHGDEAAADVLDRFDSLVRETLEGRSGTFVKQIGDEVMLTFTHPVDGVRFVADLDAAARREPNFPALRAGLHAGPVLYRVGDYVGHTVNLASRIAAVANAHETLMTEPVAARAIEEGIAVSAVGARTLAGVDEPVELWRLERDDGDASVRDPVCGMAVGDDAAAHLVYGGLDYSFCSPECLRRFIEDPGRYVRGLTPTEER
jgi:class 3 adenylate cyclase